MKKPPCKRGLNRRLVGCEPARGRFDWRRSGRSFVGLVELGDGRRHSGIQFDEAEIHQQAFEMRSAAFVQVGAGVIPGLETFRESDGDGGRVVGDDSDVEFATGLDLA